MKIRCSIWNDVPGDLAVLCTFVLVVVVVVVVVVVIGTLRVVTVAIVVKLLSGASLVGDIVGNVFSVEAAVLVTFPQLLVINGADVVVVFDFKCLIATVFEQS